MAAHFAQNCDKALPDAGGLFTRLYELVRARMDRQAIFERPQPPSLWVILDEGVLHRCIFAIASCNGAPGTVYMESPDQGQTTELASVVAKVSATFDTLRAQALPRGASRDLIRRVAEERWTD